MKKIYFICITLIVLLSITTVNASFFGFGQPDEKIIYINSQDSNMSGKVHIIEYTSYNNYKDYEGGASNDILITNGKAKYNLHDDTKFFKVGPYIDDIKLTGKSEDSPLVIVEYKLNNKTILSSASNVRGDECEITFGFNVHSINGDNIIK